MRKTIDFAWKAMKTECERFQEKDSTIIFDEAKFDVFSELFRKQYKDIMNNFMKDTTELDSHKQAAIITISALRSKAIQHNVEGDNISIVPQLIAINVALSYMNDRLNELLSKKKLKEIEQYRLPVAIACDTPYIEIMSRILYYEQVCENMDFNVLELADRYFLLEYINLLEHKIEPFILKES